MKGPSARQQSRSVYDLLTIDDRSYDVEIVRAVLKDRNHRIRFNTVPVSEALEFVNRQGKYADAPVADLVLIDVTQDGVAVDVLTTLRRHSIWRLIPLIALTRDDAQARRCYELGANACVSKPAGPEDLAVTIGAIDSFWFSVAQLLPPERRLRALIEEENERARAEQAVYAQRSPEGRNEGVGYVRQSAGKADPAARGADD